MVFIPSRKDSTIVVDTIPTFIEFILPFYYVAYQIQDEVDNYCPFKRWYIYCIFAKKNIINLKIHRQVF